MSKILAAAVVAVGASMATSAFAAVTTVTVNGTSGPQGAGPAKVTCEDTLSPVCLGIIGGTVTVSQNKVSGGTQGSLDNTAPYTADLYSIGSSNEDNEAAALNLLAGTNYLETDAAKTDTGGVGFVSFMSNAAWIAIKIGNEHFFIKNTAGQKISVEYDKNGTTGTGISHYTEFGGMSPVPIPAALPLLALGLGGLGFAGYRQRRKAA